MRRPEPGRRPRARRLASPFGLVASSGALLIAGAARAQSLEPRAYSPGPVDVNFLVAAAARSTGGLSVGADIRLADAKLTLTSPTFAYARTLDLWGRSGKIDVIVPLGRLEGSALFKGDPVGRTVTGPADPLVRLSVLLYGAPAMTPADFRSYRPDLIVGASVQLSIPVGQYDKTRLINLGANRWWVKPELGMSKAWGPWTIEMAAAATIYSENPDFFGGHRRSQEPIYSARTSAIYSFRSGVWGSLDATWFTGGRTSMDGLSGDDLQRNWRVGATLAVPVTRRTSLKFSASRGVSARTGNNYDQIAVAWQYRWGAGL